MNHQRDAALTWATAELIDNRVAVTDEAGKWKKYWMDGFGHVTPVQEPDPSNPTAAS